MNAADCPTLPIADALASIERMPAVLDAALADRPVEVLRARTEAGGSFSLVEHACHLRDLEREGYALRLRRMLAEETPELEGFPGDVIARQRDYPNQDARSAARDFARARRELVAGFAALDAAQLERTGRFAGRTITVKDLACMIVQHDSEHREEIARLVASLPAP
ncbi:hypothetical protein BWI17_12055 [Betaproteobacteria bacterium GR16-43]|nr:hypothetical protein BWI17_12055 [Betaproteobacteria bacterium GR16-43]